MAGQPEMFGLVIGCNEDLPGLRCQAAHAFAAARAGADKDELADEFRRLQSDFLRHEAPDGDAQDVDLPSYRPCPLARLQDMVRLGASRAPASASSGTSAACSCNGTAKSGGRNVRPSRHTLRLHIRCDRKHIKRCSHAPQCNEFHCSGSSGQLAGGFSRVRHSRRPLLLGWQQ